MLNKHEILRIGEEVKIFKQNFNISSYPVNTIELIKNAYDHSVILCSLEMEQDSDVDVVTNYYEAFDKYVMVINKHRVNSRLLKRLNFSLAHELAHIALKHNKIVREMDQLVRHTYDETLDKELLEYYSEHPRQLEEEADEFAGQLLVSNDVLKKCNKKSITYLTDYFFVSQKCLEVRFDILESLEPAKIPRLPSRVYSFPQHFSRSLADVINNDSSTASKQSDKRDSFADFFLSGVEN